MVNEPPGKSLIFFPKIPFGGLILKIIFYFLEIRKVRGQSKFKDVEQPL